MKAHQDKIRATFYIDKKLYQLLKRCSQIEEIPMSSIINDDILKQRVGKYILETPDQVSLYEDAEMDQAEQREKELEYAEYGNSPEGRRDSERHKVNSMLERKIISDADAQKKLLEIEEKYNDELKIENEEEAQKKILLHERWVKAVANIPVN